MNKVEEKDFVVKVLQSVDMGVKRFINKFCDDEKEFDAMMPVVAMVGTMIATQLVQKFIPDIEEEELINIVKEIKKIKDKEIN